MYPRHYFLDSAFDKAAYEDKAFLLPNHKLSRSLTLLRTSRNCLTVKQYEKILEIGTGSGYQAIVSSRDGSRRCLL